MFCVLDQFHRGLRHRGIYAHAAARWADPQAKLFARAAWDQSRLRILNALQLPDNPRALLDDHTRSLAAADRVSSRA